MSQTRAVQALSLVIMSVMACAQPASQPSEADTQAAIEAINQVREREIPAISAGDSATLVSVYAPDIDMMAPGEPAVKGQDGLRPWLSQFLSQFNVTGRYSSSVVTVSGDMAVDRYTGELTLTPKAGGAAVTEQIKGVHVMKRQPDGTWLIAQDVWNADAPPAAPVAPPPPK
jgi:uncharacterized protein (TIGR02246 family)